MTPRLCAAAALAALAPVALRAAGESPAAAPEAPPANPYSVSVEESEGFQPYRRILDRMPFGALPPGFDPEAQQDAAAAAKMTAEEKALADQAEELIKKTRICALNVNPEGKQYAGITVREEKGASRSYYLEEGQERDGWTLISVDVAARTAKVKKDGVEALLSMDSPGQATGVSQSAGQPVPRGGTAFRSPGAGRAFPAGAADGARPGGRRSFAADLRARRAEERMAREAREAENKARAEEMARRERELNQERERTRADFEALREDLSRLREEREAAERARREREEREAAAAAGDGANGGG